MTDSNKQTLQECLYCNSIHSTITQFDDNHMVPCIVENEFAVFKKEDVTFEVECYNCGKKKYIKYTFKEVILAENPSTSIKDIEKAADFIMNSMGTIKRIAVENRILAEKVKRIKRR